MLEKYHMKEHDLIKKYGQNICVILPVLHDYIRDNYFQFNVIRNGSSEHTFTV